MESNHLWSNTTWVYNAGASNTHGTVTEQFVTTISFQSNSNKSTPAVSRNLIWISFLIQKSLLAPLRCRIKSNPERMLHLACDGAPCSGLLNEKEVYNVVVVFVVRHLDFPIFSEDASLITWKDFSFFENFSRWSLQKLKSPSSRLLGRTVDWKHFH